MNEELYRVLSLTFLQSGVDFLYLDIRRKEWREGVIEVIVIPQPP